MDSNHTFSIIRKINTVLILLILIGVLSIIVFFIVEMRGHQQDRTVEVTNNSTPTPEADVKLQLGNLQKITGHNTSYITLNSKKEGGKLGSGNRGSHMRNILFFVGQDMNPKWLYKHHNHLILCLCTFKTDYQKDQQRQVIGLYVHVIKTDTNGDGKLSKKDKSTIALINTDGSSYQEIETNIDQIIDSDVTDDGQSAIFIVQVGTDIIMKKYSLITQKKLSEQIITNIKRPSNP